MKKKYKEIELTNKTEIDNIQNDYNNLKNNYDNIMKENNTIKNENSFVNNELEKLRQKLLTQEKYETELEQIKKKYFTLEEQVNQKKSNIENLQRMNEVLETKLNCSNDNYNKILNEQSNLKIKLKQLQNLCENYECQLSYLKLQKCNDVHPIHPILNENEIKEYNFDYGYSGSIDNNNNIVNRNKKRIFYKHNNDEKIIANGDNLKNEIENYSGHTYSNNFYTLDNNMNKNKKFKLNYFIPNNYYLHTNRNNNKGNFYDNKYISKTKIDKSFGYSNYLLDNLKNKISKVDFNNC